ncbi:hypothetical protein BDM02DRAFT_3215706 [Thelephora ganbajun]|uniref:Uncharacterized protein n=1 Tax=Thelephora ganbajun TaxID=370292 RepID=A0ACB6ZWP0_THEGA|nr:hypothetical protein BDM02DRAFT_3215706 [Thelephora ganbajun]
MYFARNESQSPSASNSQTLQGTNTKDHTPPPATPIDPILLPIPVTTKLDPSPASPKRKGPPWLNRSLKVHWIEFKKRLGTGTAPSTSSVHDYSATGSIHDKEPVPGQPDDEVDEIVVDREWAEDARRTTTKSESAHPLNDSRQPGGTSTDHESFATVEGFWARSTILIILRWRLWPAILSFFRPRFTDTKSEAQYSKESWFYRKRLAIFSALFFICNWITACVLVQRPVVLSDIIFYYVIGPLLCLPLFFLVVYDFPRDRPWLYQTYLGLSVWSWPLYTITFMYICGYYAPHKDYVIYDCGAKDFISLFYYASALQAMALFGLNFERFPAMIGMLTFLIASCALFLPVRQVYARNAINFLVFQAFLLYVHYTREHGERRLYTLRDQLKVQYKATQKAQVNERRTADSKRRLTSYVRVPLNTALLAVQNMVACGAVAKTHEVEFKALESSLNMMSKVLNDVLDFHRMDSGKFESSNKPYVFHQVMRSLFSPLRLDTDSRQLQFETHLDPAIDEVASRAFLAALGQSDGEIEKSVHNCEGVVVGDEMRLRQVITNLAGNACKFTPAGGKISITTKLVIPSPEDLERNLKEPTVLNSPSAEGDPGTQLSAEHLDLHNLESEQKKTLDRIVVRIEVTDTGYGIEQKEMYRIKLFRAFNQTEQGRQQGGKGTGLGLALVRQIVKLSGGRLGLISKVGKGSTFWVELPLGVGEKALTILSEDKRPANPRIRSMDRGPPTAPHSPGSDSTPGSPSAPFLEQRSNPDGLVQLLPRNYDARNRDMVNVCKATTSDSMVTTPESPPAVDEELACVESSEVLKMSGGITSRPRHIDLPTTTFGDMRTGGPQTPGSVSVLTNASRSTLTEITPGLQVLVVDDDRMTRLLMTRMLERLRCVVTTAANGKQALQLLLDQEQSADTPAEEQGSNFPIDGREIPRDNASVHMTNKEGKFAVTFLDNQMPIMSGVEMVRKLRMLGREDLIVGVTGNALLPDQEEYLEAGADHVLTKPVREENLRGMLSVADERRKTRAKNSCQSPPQPELSSPGGLDNSAPTPAQ